MTSCIFLNRSIILICLSNSLSLRGRTAHTVIFPFGDVMRSICFFAISPPLFVLLVVKHFPKFTNNACLCVNIIPFHLSSSLSAKTLCMAPVSCNILVYFVQSDCRISCTSVVYRNMRQLIFGRFFILSTPFVLLYADSHYTQLPTTACLFGWAHVGF